MDPAKFEEAVSRLAQDQQPQQKTDHAEAVVSLLSHDFPVVSTRQLQALADSVEKTSLQVFTNK